MHFFFTFCISLFILFVCDVGKEFISPRKLFEDTVPREGWRGA